MGRFITLNQDNVVISVRYGASAVGSEIESVDGNINQKRMADGTFSDVEDPQLNPGEQDPYDTADIKLIAQEISDLKQAIAELTMFIATPPI